MRQEGECLVTCLIRRSFPGLSLFFRAAAWVVWSIGAIGGCLLCYGEILAESGIAGLAAGVLLTPLTFLITPVCVFLTQHDAGLIALNYGSLILGAWLHNTSGCLGAAAEGVAPAIPQPSAR
jgi:hypothetical protein